MSNNNAPKRNLIFNQDVRQANVEEIIKGIIEINTYDDKKEIELNNHVREPIHLVINTNGGSVYDGFALIGVIDTSKTPVYTYAYGKIFSMGIPLFIAGHKRFAHPLATFMYHQLSSGTGGKLLDMFEDVEETKRLQGVYDTWILDNTTIPRSKLQDSYEKKYDWFISAKEAKSLGVVDEILESKRKRVNN